MTIGDYVSIIWRRKWVIILTTVLTLASSAAGAWFLPPTYTASTRLQLATTALGLDGRVDYADLLYADRLMNTYAHVATGDAVMAELKRQLGLTDLPKIVVDILPDTELMQISVKDHDPHRSAMVANTLAEIVIVRMRAPYSEQSQVMRDTIKVELSKLERELIEVQQMLTSTTALPGKDGAGVKDSGQLADLGQTAQLKREQYSRLLEQYQQNHMSEALRSVALEVADPATVPQLPSGPSMLIILLLGFGFGLAAGLGLAFLLEGLKRPPLSHTQLEAKIEETVSPSAVTALAK